MKLTQASDIKQRLLEGWDPSYYDSCYQQLRYAFGEPWNAQGATTTDSFMPYFPDITARNLEIGKSRRIITSQFVGLSKIMYNNAEPEYTSLDPMIAEARKQFLMARQRGDGYGNGAWEEEKHRAFMEGDGLGIGFLQLGLSRGMTGQQMVSVRHSPTLLTIGDRTERSPDRWRWIAFVHYIPKDQAEAAWGEEKVRPYVKAMTDGQQTHPVQAMRLIEYYDLGHGKGDPTRALIPDAFDQKPFEIGENPFECLPFSYYMHFIAPGMRRPVGRIVLQMATQEALNEIEEYMLHTVRTGKGFDVADIQKFENQDLKDLRGGKTVRLVRRKTAPETGEKWERVTPMEVSQSTLATLDLMERRFTEGSSVTDFDRGLNPGKNRTLGENQLVDTRGQIQSAWSVRQAISFECRTYEKAAKIAAKFDREPVQIEYFGASIPVNVPGQPESSCEHFLSEPARPTISEEAMTFAALKQKRRERLQDLLVLVPQVQMGWFSPDWWRKEVLKALGEKDINAAIGAMPGMALNQPVPAGVGQYTPGAQPPTLQTPTQTL